MHRWLEVSQGLYWMFRPPGSGVELFGEGMDSDALAALLSRESAAVDEDLLTICRLPGEQEVGAYFREIPRDRLIVLWTRWSRYMLLWQELRDEAAPQHWMPPTYEDIWRGIFLSLVDDRTRLLETAKQLWPEAF